MQIEPEIRESGPQSEAEDYQMVAAGPPVPHAEVEAEGEAMEVMLLWGRNVLQVSHVDPGGSYAIGDPAAGPVDYLMSESVIGASRWLVIDSGRVQPPKAGRALSFIDGELREYDPTLDAEVRFELDGFELRLRRVRAGKKIATGSQIDRRPYVYVGSVMALAAGLLGVLALVPPSASAISLDHLDQDSRLLAIFDTALAQEEEEIEITDPGDAAGTEGQAHEGEEGAMGDESSPQTNRHYSVQGPADNDAPTLSRHEQMEQASTAGILGTLAAMQNSFTAPTSPFGADRALGRDAESFLGALMGDLPGTNGGAGGLGLHGTGRGAGGLGRGTVGLGDYGTLGHGCRGGNCAESGGQYGRVGNLAHRGHRGRVPQIRRGGLVDTRGGLSRETIQRVVRRHHNEVRHCYGQALQSRPDLQGRVTTRFIISPTGAVQTALVSASTLGHQQTESCIASAIRRWAFPAPEDGGLVSVTYPFTLAPAN